MPKSNKVTADCNRQRIVEKASSLFREKGIENVTVAEVMQGASMTHGGFYKHFASKAALAAEACAGAYGQVEKARKTWLDGEGRHTLTTFIENYLSVRHCDNPGHGCPIAALASDVARAPENAQLHMEYLAGLEAVVAELNTRIEHSHPEKEHSALGILATLVGALVISRATKGSPISEQVLLEAVSFLKRRPSASSTM
ncbi:TetR/AcrR family transcriptional regulator [Noviherbaspirillum aerium]|uniref:TetR/AcrR family transcriptional regulator n=1 Tax=Noviherbaspirillum aerium TaxID=2588497 RepID=UPI00178C5483|nr:TetR/AcrR family transcriptional regulator [Noviherbaspirillum aerium]